MDMSHFGVRCGEIEDKMHNPGLTMGVACQSRAGEQDFTGACDPGELDSRKGFVKEGREEASIRRYLQVSHPPQKLPQECRVYKGLMPFPTPWA